MVTFGIIMEFVGGMVVGFVIGLTFMSGSRRGRGWRIPRPIPTLDNEPDLKMGLSDDDRKILIEKWRRAHRHGSNPPTELLGTIKRPKPTPAPPTRRCGCDGCVLERSSLGGYQPCANRKS